MVVGPIAKKIAQTLSDPKKLEKFTDFIKTGKYKDKVGKVTDVEKEVIKVKPKDLDLETLSPITPSKMKKGGLVRGVRIAKKGFKKTKIY
jgi:hypothetical protein